MALPKGVKSPVDYTKLYMSNELDGESINEKKEPKLPKTKSNVKSLNMASVKSGEPITAKARGMINRLLGGIDTSREDKVSQKLVNQAKKSKNSASFRAMQDVAKGTAPRRGLAKLAARAGKALAKTPKGALLAGGLIGGVAAARAIGRKFNEIRKKRRDAAIDKQVDKYVADRKIPGGPKKVNYKPTNQYTVTRDSKGKVTGTGKLIRVVPGTEFKEATMTPAQKRKDTMLKKKYEKSDDMMDSFKDQYGKKKGKEVFYAFIRKKSMEEENIQEILDKKDIPHVKKLVGKLRKGSKTHAKQADDLEKAMKEDVFDEGAQAVLRPLVKGASYFIRKLSKSRNKLVKKGLAPTMMRMPKFKKSDLSQYAMYHGTSSKSADKIMKSGKFKKSIGDVMNPDGSMYTGKRAFATTDPKRAKEYADMTAKYRGGKPEVLAVKVRDSKIMNPSGIPDEYYVKTKAMKPVGRGVKPIKIKKGQVMQNSFNPLEENSVIESELLIQDWNKDDIKFTEIETVDIIKPKPLKESMSNWREDLGEDWQKVNRKDKTDGLSKKAVKAYRRENPGSKLQTAVTKDPKKLKKGSKDAKRRLSFCRRMKGMKKKLTSAKTRRDPDSRINKALRRWNC